VKYTVLTLFPEIVDAFFASSIMAKAIQRGLIGYRSINIRDFATDKHHKCDDAPYGGGAGMLMLPEPLGRALEFAGAVNKQRLARESGTTGTSAKKARVVYLSPSGRLFTQDLLGNSQRRSI